MYWKVLLVLTMRFCRGSNITAEEPQTIQLFDMTHATSWRDLSDYYVAVERGWKICYHCGIPGLGTSLHMEYSGNMQPSVIPAEYLLTRLMIIDVSVLTDTNPTLTLTLRAAQQWLAVKRDPREPSLLIFKFGWKDKLDDNRRHKCLCQGPGLSYELAQWIATNLSHVVGVGTDAPTLESEETRELSARTVTNLLGSKGIYMLENVNLRRKIPETGCMAIAMPLKMLSASYVPARLTAFCAPRRGERVVLAQRPAHVRARSRGDDVDLDDII